MQSFVASKLIYSQYGEPSKVLQKVEEKLDQLKRNEVLIKMLAAPVNPADINTIQGTYAVKPKLPAVGGNEGVGEVIRIGNDVKKFSLGDRVVPLVNALGTWRSHLIVTEKSILKVPKELGLVEAATITVNPATAYRMLRDFATLKENDVIIQNGANSACGQYVAQLCKAWGLVSVNIVRNRPNINELKTYLTDLGASYVLTEEELRQTNLFKSEATAIPRPKLALNCVGGRCATELMRQLAPGGTMVTYGGMSREPVTIATSALIFKDIKVVGYWMTRWSSINADSPQRFQMYEELIELMKDGKLCGPAFQFIDFDDFQTAIQNTLSAKGMAGRKYILQFK
ncbi:hypothetical protein Trydic_g23902 [Trypoxylus dichotomus]